MVPATTSISFRFIKLIFGATDPVHIAIIGGTGLGSLPSPPFEPVATLPPPSTPWGRPSSPISILSYTPPTSSSTGASNKSIPIAFLARHGLHHQLTPHEIPNQANIAALRKLGVRCVVAFSAVGSLKEEVKPRDFVVVDQVIDWTRGVSDSLFCCIQAIDSPHTHCFRFWLLSASLVVILGRAPRSSDLMGKRDQQPFPSLTGTEGTDLT